MANTSQRHSLVEMGPALFGFAGRPQQVRPCRDQGLRLTYLPCGFFGRGRGFSFSCGRLDSDTPAFLVDRVFRRKQAEKHNLALLLCHGALLSHIFIAGGSNPSGVILASVPPRPSAVAQKQLILGFQTFIFLHVESGTYDSGSSWVFGQPSNGREV